MMDFVEYILERIDILKDLHIWKKMSKYEQLEFKTCKTEIQIDNKMKMLRHKYL